MDLNKLMNFDWRSLQKYTSAQSAEDLNHFLEEMPQNVGQTMLAIAAIVWCAGGATGLYASMQMKKMTELRGELESAQALQPSVPKLTQTAVSGKAISSLVDTLSEIYTGLDIKASGAEIRIGSKTAANFGQFRELMSHIQNGGDGWRIEISKLCVGRECKRNTLSATLKINKVSVR